MSTLAWQRAQTRSSNVAADRPGETALTWRLLSLGIVKLRKRLEIRELAEGRYGAHAGQQSSSSRWPTSTARTRCWTG